MLFQLEKQIVCLFNYVALSKKKLSWGTRNVFHDPVLPHDKHLAFGKIWDLLKSTKLKNPKSA